MVVMTIIMAIVVEVPMAMETFGACFGCGKRN
jgi:hypothetical protein